MQTLDGFLKVLLNWTENFEKFKEDQIEKNESFTIKFYFIFASEFYNINNNNMRRTFLTK